MKGHRLFHREGQARSLPEDAHWRKIREYCNRKERWSGSHWSIFAGWMYPRIQSMAPSRGPMGRIIHSFGGNVLIYGRSMMKPFMMKVFAEVLDKELNWDQKSISCSSHNGDTEHRAAAQSILNESEWGLMQCPLDVPLVQFGRQVRRPRRWFHTCSGEHAAVLKGMRLLGIRRAGYTLPNSDWFPLYIDVLRVHGRSGLESRQGCKRWVWDANDSNTVNELAIMFANLGSRRDEDWIWEAMNRNPDLVGGFNRLDSTCLKAGRGRSSQRKVQMDCWDSR